MSFEVLFADSIAHYMRDALAAVRAGRLDTAVAILTKVQAVAEKRVIDTAPKGLVARVH